MALLYLKHILLDMLPSTEMKARGQLLSISNHLEMIHDGLWAINGIIQDGQLQVRYIEILRKNSSQVDEWLSNNSMEKATVVENLIEKVKVEEWMKEVDSTIVDAEELLSRILLWKPIGMTKTSADKYSSSNHYFFPPTLNHIKHVLFKHFTLIELKEMTRRLNYLQRRGYALGLHREILDCMNPLQEDYGNILRDEVIGREEDRIHIINILKEKQQLPINDNGNNYTTSIIFIEKDNVYIKIEETILTHMIYHDHWVRENFKYRIWVDASNIWDLDSTRILDEFQRSIKGEEYSIQKEKNANWSMMKDLLGNNRYLLILNEYNYSSHFIDQWRKLKDALLHLGGAGSAAIITMPYYTRFDRNEKDIEMYSLFAMSEEVRTELVMKQVAAIQPTSDQLHEAHTAQIDLLREKCRSLAHARIVGALARCSKMKGWSADATASDALVRLSLFIMESFSIPTSLSFELGYYGVLFTLLSICYILLSEKITSEGFKLDYFKDMLQMCEAEGFLYSSITHYLSPSKLLKRISYFKGSTKELSRWCFYLRVGEEDAGIRIPPQCLYLSLSFLGIHTASRSLLLSHRRSLSTGINKRIRALVILDKLKKEHHISSSIMQEDQLVYEIMKDIFAKLKCLRILYIRGIKIREIPKMLGRLHSLRYIKLFEMEITALPKSLFNLSNLKILNIDHCEQLQKLPKHIHKLANLILLKLRYCTRLQKLPKSISRLIGLEEINVEGCHWLTELPEGLEKIKNLRVLAMAECASLTKMSINIRCMTRLETLSGLVASFDDDGSRCVIHELQEVTNLRTLELRNLERVSKEEEEIGRINLQDKRRLEQLSLHWEYWNTDEDGSDAAPLQVIKALKPDSEHLKSLQIISYQNQDFPSWIKQDEVPTTGVLDYLTEIRFINLRKCKRLPPLGHLPFLDTIVISGMDLTDVIDDEGTFKSLSFLTLSEMSELEEWKSVQGLHLKELTLIQCPKFKGFHQPRIISVDKLNIWLNNGALWISNSSFWNSFKDVNWLEIVGCHDLRIFSLDMHELSTHKLTIISCNNLEALPNWLSNILKKNRGKGELRISVISEQLKEQFDVKVEGCPKLGGF